jgi:hypothetical protein
LGRARRRVFDVVSSASYAVEGQQCPAHRRIELRADRLVNRKVTSAAGGPHALILQVAVSAFLASSYNKA